MDTRKMVENVFSIVEFLNNNFPGGFANIKGLQVNAHRATSIPIYASFKSPNDVKVPEVKPKKPTAYKTYTDELTTLDNAKVTVKPTGEVLVQRIETGGNKDESILITDEDIIMANKIIKDNVKESEKKKKSRKRKQKGGIFEETPEKKQKIGKENTKSIAVNINKYKKNLKNTDQQKHDKNTKKAIMTGARPIKDKGKNGIELKRENSKTENANMAVGSEALNGIRESKQKAEKVLEKTPKTTKIGHRTNEVAKNGIKENIVDQNPSKEKKTHIISSGKINKNINSNISKIKKNKCQVLWGDFFVTARFNGSNKNKRKDYHHFEQLVKK
ncbi:hypothetical protein NQ317_000376 [Molorchus minor]|uniref:Uncharacterized protein n=1 Tax=Molorchus minor TaxID=1323400 RepID=A0ABQ9J964_9CUCU|nr:hypothetical protein NQ317_000376 [Molorchus minor]